MKKICNLSIDVAEVWLRQTMPTPPNHEDYLAEDESVAIGQSLEGKQLFIQRTGNEHELVAEE